MSAYTPQFFRGFGKTNLMVLKTRWALDRDAELDRNMIFVAPAAASPSITLSTMTTACEKFAREFDPKRFGRELEFAELSALARRERAR